jgi:hypothetical protein
MNKIKSNSICDYCEMKNCNMHECRGLRFKGKEVIDNTHQHKICSRTCGNAPYKCLVDGCDCDGYDQFCKDMVFDED